MERMVGEWWGDDASAEDRERVLALGAVADGLYRWV
jgi:hypothetical protein